MGLTTNVCFSHSSTSISEGMRYSLEPSLIVVATSGDLSKRKALQASRNASMATSAKAGQVNSAKQCICTNSRVLAVLEDITSTIGFSDSPKGRRNKPEDTSFHAIDAWAVPSDVVDDNRDMIMNYELDADLPSGSFVSIYDIYLVCAPWVLRRTQSSNYHADHTSDETRSIRRATSSPSLVIVLCNDSKG